MTRLPTPLTDGDPRPVATAPDALVGFVEAGVLGPADVHVAATLARRGGDERPEVLLAVALAVRAPRRRHVCVDLTTVRDGVVTDLVEQVVRTVDDDPAGDATEEALLATLPWPEPAAWRAALAASPLIAQRDPGELAEPDDAGQDVPPLTLAGDRLYLDRYWRYERRVAVALDARSRRTSDVTSPTDAAATLEALFDGTAPDRQRLAAATALRGPLTVLAGGPGTGKTTTVARVLRVLAAEARRDGQHPPAVALAAPTGKAAARLSESLREAAADLADDDPDAPLLQELGATTLHRLLGARGRSSRFRHDRRRPLPHDVVVVDETSMVPLALLAKLVDAVRDDARLVLVGDPHQLASVEAGSVLADVVGDPDATPQRSRLARAELAALAGDAHVADTGTAAGGGLHDSLVVLDRVHRFRADSGLDRFATAVRHGDADAALAALTEAADLTWLTPSVDGHGGDRDRGHDGGGEHGLDPVRQRVTAAGRAVLTAATAGDGLAALAALDDVRVLCAHRRGSHGVAGWVPRCEGWLRDDAGLDLSDRWYVGRPVLVTTNDRRLRLWNGDIGVTVRAPGGDGVRIAFPGLDGQPVRLVPVARVGEVDTVHAMTVHKAQGSQVRHAVVVLPDPASRLCTRELLYTAVTRAREGATLVATEEALRATIGARTQRASGLGVALGR